MNSRAAVFDLFGTLVPPFPDDDRADLRGMADAVGADRDEFTRAWFSDGASFRRDSGEHGSIEAEVRSHCAALGIDPTEGQLAEALAIRTEFTRASLSPRPDAVPTLRALREAGLRTALVSDCSAEVPDLWPETPFAAVIEVPIFSCVARLKKPDPRIFRLACDALGVAPEQCAYVGDGYSNELSGAAAVGMRAIHLAPPDEVASDHPTYEGGTWEGDRIGSLAEVLSLLGRPPQKPRSSGPR
ncbi:MAG: HAD family hydrolase [Planctomycetota bacterium]|jgi:putative hydrolase of the HAD superfamily